MSLHHLVDHHHPNDVFAGKEKAREGRSKWETVCRRDRQKEKEKDPIKITLTHSVCEREAGKRCLLLHSLPFSAGMRCNTHPLLRFLLRFCCCFPPSSFSSPSSYIREKKIPMKWSKLLLPLLSSSSFISN